ncbi:MAG: response regulator [Synergistales bacterium]|nr:response regulator [Synergistales bacterium]
MGGLGFKSINNRLILWFVIVSLVPLIIMTALTYDQRIRSVRTEAFNKLQAIRTLKQAQIEQWIDHGSEQLDYLCSLVEKAGINEIIEGSTGSTRGISIFSNIKKELDDYAGSMGTILEMTISDLNGNVMISTKEESPGKNLSSEKYFQSALVNDNTYISDVLKDPAGIPHIIMAKHLLSPETRDFRRTRIGVMTLSLSLQNPLFLGLVNRTGLGNTGEAYLVGSNGMAISSLLWKDNASMNMVIDSPAAIRGAKGETGTMKDLDYRGEEVLAAYTFIPGPRWGLVIKQDLIEVYTPIYSMLHIMLIIFSFSVSGACALAIIISRTISKPIMAVTEVARKIDGGELNARNTIDRADEVGILARTINAMADSLLSLIRTQDGITGIISTAVTHEGTTDFARSLVKKLEEITESGMGGFYLLSSDRSCYKNIASSGIAPNGREKDIPVPTMGKLFQATFMRKSISYLEEIPENDIFMFRTTAGPVSPREMICIPLILDREVRALIILASVWSYSQEQRNMIDLAWNSINTTFSNIVTNEKTNLLAKELAQKNTELRIQSDKLKAQSSELRSQSEELLEQNIELEYQRKQVEEANRLKSEFLSNMSHELRTPLNSILALSRVLKTQTLQKLTSEESKYLEVIERNGKNLLALINDILDLSKIEAGKVEVAPDLFSMKQAIEEIAESMIPMVAEKDVDLQLDISPDLPDIESDEEKVGKILLNIIGNAVKFTHEGSVTISARMEGDNISVEVADTGIGIPEKELPYIFDEFRQVDGTSSRQFEGTGLGLAICKKTSQMLGGKIFVDSQVGVGSKFTILLPVQWQGKGKIVSRLKFRPKPSKVMNPNKGRKILVVDDDFKSRTIISEYLSTEGYDVISADSGDKAIKMAYLYQPFAITLDLIMPDMDGWEVLQRLKQDERTRDIPVIIISVSDEEDTGFALGALGFITKPVDPKLLVREIGKIGGNAARTIMIVDDNEIDRKEISRNLMEEGFTTIMAKNGEEGLSLLGSTNPDILILDLLMPGMDGFEVIRKIKTSPDTVDLPVIIVTAKDLTLEERKALSGLAESVLGKTDHSASDIARDIKNTILRLESVHGDQHLSREKALKKILMVEDNEIAALQVKMVLEQEGFLVDSVSGGEQAMKYLSESIPDGIILDLMMPEIDGFEVLRTLRRNKETHDIPVLVLTAKELDQDDFERLSSGNVEKLIHKGDIDREGLLLVARQVFNGTSPGGGIKIAELPEDPASDPVIEETLQGQIKSHNGITRVLIVEDNPDNLFTLKTIMGKNYTYLEAMDGEQGLDVALKEIPDIILLDISLPKMDGYEVAKRLKENNRTRKIPIIAVTARAMKGEREKALACGCDDYISKPIDQNVLEEKLSFWIKG